jgi:hypothetical protein
MSPMLELLCIGPTNPEEDLGLKHACKMESCAYVYGVELRIREILREGHSPFWACDSALQSPALSTGKSQDDFFFLAFCTKWYFVSTEIIGQRILMLMTSRVATADHEFFLGLASYQDRML